MIMKDIWMKQEMKMKEINEKTFRDRGSGFALSVPKKYDMVYSEQ